MDSDMKTGRELEADILAGLPKQSQDDYCADCAHVDACNVMLKDGEECGDRYEMGEVELTDAGRQARLEEAEDFDVQVRECLDRLAHWPGIQAVDLDA